jgi:hypothetical protein
LVPLDTFFKTDRDIEQELIKALRKTGKDIKWINKYFDMVKDMLTEFQIDENSPKIAMSVTKGSRIAISIGQRYVIHPMADVIGFILPLEFNDIISDYSNLTGTAYFQNKKGEKEAFWGEFDGDIIFSDDAFLLENWKNAIKAELNRTTTSSYRKYHNPFYYKAVMDLNYRKAILNSVY